MHLGRTLERSNSMVMTGDNRSYSGLARDGAI